MTKKSSMGRELLEAFKLNGQVCVWACSHCEKMFFSGGGAEMELVSGHILLEFGRHRCVPPSASTLMNQHNTTLEIEE